MPILITLSMTLFIVSCSSLGTGVKAFSVSELSPDGFPMDLDHESHGHEREKNPMFVNNHNEAHYVIKPGDKLSIKFFFNPELNEEELIVRPDGRISLQLIHEVEAANLTPLQLKSLLAERYAKQIKTPEIAVIVRAINVQPIVYVEGQVRNPGELEIIDSLSVLQAVARANGFVEDKAKIDEVIIMRQDQNGRTFVIKLNLTAALNGVDLTQDIQLHPNDFVHVPRSFW